MKVLTIQVNVSNLTPDEIDRLQHAMVVQCEDAGGFDLDDKDLEGKGTFDAQVLVSKVADVEIEEEEEVNEIH